MKLEYAPAAISDLREIRHYIRSDLHNPKAAMRISKAILDTCSSLKTFPEMGMSVEAKTGFETDLRMVVCENWIAVYCVDVDSNTVSVARIIDARQDYMRILFGEMDFAPATQEQESEERPEQESHQLGPTMTF